MQAQQKAGLAGRRGRTRERLLARNVRDNLHRGQDPASLYVSARLKAAGKYS